MSERTMLILMGLPGSGKTDYAKNLMSAEPNKWFRINWDELRRSDPSYAPGRFSREQEDKMQANSFTLAQGAVEEGFDLIIDNTNLNQKTVGRWMAIADKLKMRVDTYFMPATRRLCSFRDLNRKDRVGQAVIDRMALWNNLIAFDDGIVIVDMDGTLANCEHRKHFLSEPCQICFGDGILADLSTCTTCEGKGKRKNWNGFYQADLIAQDPPVENIKRLIKELSNHPIAIVSGRPIDQAGIATEDWLRTHDITFDYLFMRNSGDHRPDNIVKRDILNRMPKDKIFLVLDDRDSVVKMWRDNGLTCLQVNYGNF